MSLVEWSRRYAWAGGVGRGGLTNKRPAPTLAQGGRPCRPTGECIDGFTHADETRYRALGKGRKATCRPVH